MAFKVFLDSNVILSGLFSDKGAPRILLDLLCMDIPFMQGVTGQYNIVEVERNLAKKIPALLPVYRKYFAQLHMEIVPIPSKEEIRKFLGEIDDKDLPVLVSAIQGRADFLVTGDKKDFDKPKKRGGYLFKIVSPSEFLEKIVPEIFQKRGDPKSSS